MIDGWGMGTGVQVHSISTGRRVPCDEVGVSVKRRAAGKLISGNAGNRRAIYGDNYEVWWGAGDNG